MIVGTLGALEQLQNDDRDYHLTGSRFFGSQVHGSDYDFFVQNDDYIEEYLSYTGWDKEWEESYTDPIAISCWRKDNVHIQVVSDARLKDKVQEFLKNTGLLTKLAGRDKVMGRVVWTVAITMFERFLEDNRMS